MRKSVLSVLAVALSVAGQAHAALVVSISSSPIQANSPSQVISVFLRSDADPVTDIVSMDLYAFLGDGSAAQSIPRFAGVPGSRDAVRFADGGGGQAFLWEGFASGFNPSGAAPQTGNPFRSSPALLADDPSETVTIGAADSLVAQLFIDTTDYSGGTFDLTISTAGGASSEITTFDGNSINSLPFSGSFQITAVPEPSAACALGAVALVGAGIRRVRRRKPSG